MNDLTPAAALARVDAPLSVPTERLFDHALAEQALDLARPLIEHAIAQPGISGERVLHVVVVDPAERGGFDAALRAERSFGASPPWGADYRGFARAKAQLAWRTGMDTRQVQHAAPHLLRAGDTLLWGSALRDGILVAASGAHPWFDEAMCASVLELIRALAQARRRQFGQV
ncbi:MAG: hypothetical protein MUC68_02905 [Burkholderiaceae bacterium]|jgi:hypothetical protein|nr:hypothetical protein [Burkholderiaceae bacterium]